MKFLSTILTIFITACAGSGDSNGNSEQSSKALFSKWSNVNTSLNLTNAHFGTAFSMVWILKNGANCTTTAIINGNDSAGSASFSGAHWTGGGPGGDPGCSGFNNSYSYTNSGGTLTACAQTCTEFK